MFLFDTFWTEAFRSLMPWAELFFRVITELGSDYFYVALIAIGFAKPEGGTGGFARYIAICPPDWKYGVSIEEQPGAPLPKKQLPLRRDEYGVLKPTHVEK